MKINGESEPLPLPLVFVGCSDALRGLLVWLGVADNLWTASLLVAAGRSVGVRSALSSVLFSDGLGFVCACETLQFVSFPLLVAVEVGGGAVGNGVFVFVVVVAATVFLVLAVVGELFVRLVAVVVVVIVVEISVSCLFPELAFPFTALVVATSATTGAAGATADDDTPLSERISLSASDDCS